MRGLAVAARYLTIVPVPLGAGPAGGVVGLEAVGRAAAWFPVVGLAMGGALAALDQGATLVFPALLAALVTLTAWKLASGGIHLDGLADCLDGLSGRDAEHRLAIMRDSRIGAFGAIGLILVLLLELVALAEIGGSWRWRVLVVAPVVARAVPVALARLFPPARPEGQGARFRDGLGAAAAPVAVATAAVVAVGVLGAPGVLALAAAALAGLGVARLMSRPLGGITGDVLGASVEVAELAILLGAAAWTHGRP